MQNAISLVANKEEIWCCPSVNGLKLSSILPFRPRPNPWCHWLSRCFAAGSWWRTSAVTSLTGVCPEESSRLQFSSFPPYVIQCGFTLYKYLTVGVSVSTNIKWHIAVMPQLDWARSISLSAQWLPQCLIKKCIFWSHWGLACLTANPLLWSSSKIYVLQEYCTVITFPH